MRRGGLGWAAAWLLAAGAAGAAWAAAWPPGEPPAEPARIRFSFKGATFDQVIDFFSRATGLPVVRETDVPQGTLDYLAPEEYTLDEALEVLNIILQGRGVALRVRDDMLHLQKLSQMQRQDIPVYVGQLPADIRPNEIITVVRPLDIALARPLAEKLALMVAEYGSVTAMEQQNSLVITETAGQARRLLTIVDTLDRQDPDGVVEIFAIRHAKATDLMASLKALMSQRVEKYVVNQEGKQIKIEEDEMPGLAITADDRTNSVIAKGAANRVEKLREAIALLDVPGGGAGRTVRTFALLRLAPRDAAGRLGELYAKLPEQERPTILALDDAGKVTLVGEAGTLEEAAALLSEIDGGGAAAPGDAERAVTVVPVRRASPAGVAEGARSLRNGRALYATRMIAGPDGRSLVVAGTPADVEAIRALVAVLDQAPRADRRVRLARLGGGHGQETVRRARELYTRQVDPEDPRGMLEVAWDEPSRLLTAIGSEEALARFTDLLRQVQEGTAVERETQTIELEHATPSRIVPSLAALGRQVLEPRDGSAWEEPRIDPVDALQLLVVTARPDEFAAIRSLVSTLDRIEHDVPPLRIIRLRSADAEALAGVLSRRYDARPFEERRTRPVSVWADGQTNTLIVAAHPEVFGEIQAIVDELNEAERAEREIRIFPLAVARAAELAATLDEMFPEPPVPRDRAGRPLHHLQQPRDVVVRADPQTNALIVDAPAERMAGFERLVEQLDRQDAAEREVRTYRIVRADLDAVAQTVRQLAESGALNPSGAARVPVTVTAEPVSRSIVVSGPAEALPRVEELIGELDARAVTPATALRFFALRNARAESIVPMLREVLLRRIAEDVGDAGADPAAALHLSADRMTNTVILSAPPQVIAVAQSILAELDHPRSGGPAVDTRIFPLTQANAADVAGAVRAAFEARAAAEGDAAPIAVTAEPSSNSVIVTATADRAEQIAAMIESLDGAPPADRNRVRTVFLKHARAERVAPIILDLLRPQESGPALRVASDPRINAVVVSAPAALLEVAEQMIAQLDVDPAAGVASARRVRVLAVENADAAEIATALVELFEGEEAQPPALRVDRGSNSLIVAATDEQFRAIEEVVGEIDGATIAGSREMRLIPLDPSRASAQEVADTLRRMLGRRGAEVRVVPLEELLRPREPPQEQESPGPTSAVPIGTADRLLSHGRPRPAGDAAGKPWHPWFQRGCAGFAAERHSRADPTADLPAADKPWHPWFQRGCHGFAAKRHSGADPTGMRPPFLATIAVLAMAAVDEPDSAVTIAVDAATNSLVVVGPPRAIDRIAGLAEQLIDQIPQPPGTIHYVGLPPEVDAAATQRLIMEALRQLSPAGGTRGDLARRAAVIADPSNNALLVAASEFDFETIGQLIAALSRPAAVEEIVVKAYALQTITAERAAESVGRMLGADPQGRQGRRMRDLAVKLLAGQDTIEAVFNPDRVRLSIDPASNALLVTGPPEAIEFIDRLIELLDQAPLPAAATLKLHPLRHARAAELRETLRGVFRARFESLRGRLGPGVLQPEFAADERTNTLLVTASPEQLAEVDALLDQLDRELGEDRFPLRMIELSSAQPDQAAEILQKVVIGSDQARRASTLIVPDNGTGVLLVRADESVAAEIAEVLKEIDRPSTREFAVRTILLERADPSAVAGALQRLYDDRARIASTGRGRREQARRVSIIGDPGSNTVLVASSDEDFAEIERLVRHFDTPQASQALSFRVFQLRHAKAAQIEQAVQEIANEITLVEEGPWWAWWGRQQSGRSRRGVLAVQADARLNALIVTGEGDKFEVVERLIEVLDAPEPEGEERIVKVYALLHADVDVVADVLNETFAHRTRYRQWWEEPDPAEVRIRTDRRTKLIIVYGSRRQQEEIAAFIAGIDAQVAGEPQQLAVLRVEFAQAAELAATLTRFLADRARATGAPAPATTVTGSASTNTLLVSAEADDLAMIRDLLGSLDQPSVSTDRAIEIVALVDGQAEEIARIVREQFAGRRGGDGGAGAGAGVIVTPDARTNSIILNAPRLQFAQARALIERLDSPRAADETIIRTYALKSAAADEVARLLGETLALDERGETAGITISPAEGGPSVEVKAKIVADRRSNSVLVTATEESFPVIESLISKLEEVPAASPVEYRIIPLAHAIAADVHFTLRQFMRDRPDGEVEPRIDYNRLENQLIIAATADQFRPIEEIIASLDVPSRASRRTEFMPLRFAQAERVQEALSVFYGPMAFEADTPGKLNARIVADPATNSLVITADEGEWENIRALLTELDSAEYDASLQLVVLPLTYADAESVARAINEAFSAEVQRPSPGGREARRPEEGERIEREYPAVLVEAEEWVRASAEPLTNSVIVSAGRASLAKIEQIVARLDVADYARLPPPRIIPVRSGSPQQLAEALLALWEQGGGARGGRALRIVGDAASSSIVVRAEEEDFRQIKVLAEALQDEATAKGISVHVIPLRAAPAVRVAAAITEAFAAKARQSNQALAIEADRAGNTLVVACASALFDEILRTVEQLDRLSPSANQAIFIIELEHVPPEAVTDIVETIGLSRPPSDDSASRLVSEPITVAPLAGRNAVIVAANPVARETIVGLFKAIDREPGLADAKVRVIRLRNAGAQAVADLLGQILSPGDQQSGTALAQAVKEQVRRLSVQQGAEGGLRLDLTRPVRVIADPGLNAILISSTEDNVEALARIVAMFDELPITDSVTVQLYPLANIAAAQFARIVNDLFEQGKALGAVPGTDLAGVPEGGVGRALLGEIAVSVDERTNTVIVAGNVDAVALVTVLHLRIDREMPMGWIEPRVVPLRFADAADLAETLEAILVDGATDREQSSPLQLQVARLRMARLSENGGRVLEADIFSPMTRLVIRPEPDLNALILVGTPANLEVVTELVRMLDVETAAPGATVRVYPLRHATAGRLAETIARLFDQQLQAGAIRDDDKVVVQPDDRTNALVVTTSRRSFAVVEALLETLDAAVAPDLQAIQRIELTHASAVRVGSLVQQLMDARLERLRMTEPETADLERAMIVADPRTNSLVVAAGREAFDVVRALVEDLDRTNLPEHALVSMFPVRNGNAERIAEIIRALMDRRYADMPPEVRGSQQPLILTDPRSNSLLVAAGPDDVEAIDHLVAKLEAAPSNPAIQLHVIGLESTRAELLAPRVQTLMRERQQSLGRASLPSDQVSIEPDTAGNSLIVAASEENAVVVRDLVDALIKAESEATGDAQIEVIQLAGSRAADVADLLEDLYVQEANRTRGPDTVRVSVDERLNALLVNAPPPDVRAVQRLVAQLDGARPSTVVEIRYVTLNSANALETVGLIENLLSGRGLGARAGSRQATVLKYYREYVEQVEGDGGDGLTQMEVSAAIRESITLTPDLRTNTVIVAAPSGAVEMIERMIRDLDASTTGTQNIRIFKLGNADALAMAEILTDLFNLTRRGNLYVLRPRETDLGDGPAPEAGPVPAGLSGTELTAVPDDRPQLSITVDNRTNSLLVSGTPAYLDMVAQVVEELDALEANERDVFLYPLRNAVSADVARVVSSFVDQEQQKLLSTLSPDQVGAAARLLEREITIVGDEKSNTVLVSASPRYMSRVRDMITELDVDPPQVLIQVVLAEISLDTDLEWGFDTSLNLGPYGGDNLLITGGAALASTFLPTLGIPTLAIASDDFELLFQALQAQGRLQVLSNPSVMAANNQPARIQIGENIGRASSSSLATGGTQQTTVEYIDIGVILDVTPSINPDGFVRMDITPEITDLTNRTTQVTEDLQVPILTKRTANTTITVRDGQTIVIGGLISDMYENRRWKVPIIGDVPIVGLLFQSELEETRKIELLIVLTPHVITSPAEFARVKRLTDREIDRLSITPREKDFMRESFVSPTGGDMLQKKYHDAETPPGPSEPEAAPPLDTGNP